MGARREFAFESVSRVVDRGAVIYTLAAGPDEVLVGHVHGEGPRVEVLADGRAYGGPEARELLTFVQRAWREARRHAR